MRDFVYGVDVSWVSQLEAQGVYWVDRKGIRADPFALLKDMGANAVRLRVFVNPPKEASWTKPEKEFAGRKFGPEECMLGFCDKDGVLELAKRAKEQEMRLMVDFHYSDHFADPVFQDIPKAWENDSYERLLERVARHTEEVLELLGAHDIHPEWVQVGNELNTGLLLPVGSTREHPKQLVGLLNAGYQAVKKCCPDCSVVTHISGGNDYNLCTRFFDVFFEYGGMTDIMGFSYYPYWVQITHDAQKLQEDMTRLADKYRKPLMLSEIGGEEKKEEDSYRLLYSAVRAIRDIPKERGLGVFYWEPEVGAELLTDHYPLGAARLVDEKGLQFTKAMEAYRDSRKEEG
ncbi:MAG: glycosyl hydrolase 53 family protein [Roseburia sp.]|nr:glycosyl hydrolase 53 family protein [Roseburia sp.]